MIVCGWWSINGWLTTPTVAEHHEVQSVMIAGVCRSRLLSKHHINVEVSIRTDMILLLEMFPRIARFWHTQTHAVNNCAYSWWFADGFLQGVMSPTGLFKMCEIVRFSKWFVTSKIVHLHADLSLTWWSMEARLGKPVNRNSDYVHNIAILVKSTPALRIGIESSKNGVCKNTHKNP